MWVSNNLSRETSGRSVDSGEIARAREEGFVDFWVGVGDSGLIEVARYFGLED
jgi:2-haloacid dehalogenase